jgi:hypothetical protein
MNRAPSFGRWRRRILGATLLAIAAGVRPAAGQETVNVELPASVGFAIANVAEATTGSTTTVGYSSAALSSGNVVRLSVRADAASFTPPVPGTLAIAASKVSWSIAAQQNGTAANGTLSSASWGLVLQGDPGRSSGSADLVWSLAAPGGGIRAGSHQLTIRWKIESITP